jgi:hypothetical protein
MVCGHPIHSDPQPLGRTAACMPGRMARAIRMLARCVLHVRRNVSRDHEERIRARGHCRRAPEILNQWRRSADRSPRRHMLTPETIHDSLFRGTCQPSPTLPGSCLQRSTPHTDLGFGLPRAVLFFLLRRGIDGPCHERIHPRRWRMALRLAPGTPAMSGIGRRAAEFAAIKRSPKNSSGAEQGLVVGSALNADRRHAEKPATSPVGRLPVAAIHDH